ncbi:MAG: type II toxin-antitoxin system RelE/ParE family toxin [Nitrospira sp.]|nr:type II toxin-antitoxin system RelE/ParE family toxin [Nitrospira sp.]
MFSANQPIRHSRESGVGACIAHSAARTIVANPECGEPLKYELDGLRKYRVRRFRVVYTAHQKTRIIRLMAVGHRQSVYEELTERLRRKAQE